MKNLAAMHPPWHASNEPHDAHAPADPGSRSDRNSSDSRHTRGEPTAVPDAPGAELRMEHERARVHVADRVDEAHHATGAAQVEPGQGLAEGREVEERVARQHAGPLHQPVVEAALLLGGRVQLVPCVGTAAGGTQPGEPQLSAVPVGDGLESVELVDVVAGDDDADLERPEAGLGQVVHGPPGGGVGTVAPHRVVGGRRQRRRWTPGRRRSRCPPGAAPAPA